MLMRAAFQSRKLREDDHTKCVFWWRRLSESGAAGYQHTKLGYVAARLQRPKMASIMGITTDRITRGIYDGAAMAGLGAAGDHELGICFTRIYQRHQRFYRSCAGRDRFARRAAMLGGLL